MSPNERIDELSPATGLALIVNLILTSSLVKQLPAYRQQPCQQHPMHVRIYIENEFFKPLLRVAEEKGKY
jgi:hypothetical protein